MNSYELMLLFDPNLGEEKIGQIISKIEEKIKGSGGDLKKTDKWGAKRLAGTYKKLKRLSQAYYVLIYFEAPATAPPKLQSSLKVMEEILRYSIYRSSEETLAEIKGEPLAEGKVLVSEISEKKDEGKNLG